MKTTNQFNYISFFFILLISSLIFSACTSEEEQIIEDLISVSLWQIDTVIYRKQDGRDSVVTRNPRVLGAIAFQECDVKDDHSCPAVFISPHEEDAIAGQFDVEYWVQTTTMPIRLSIREIEIVEPHINSIEGVWDVTTL